MYYILFILVILKYKMSSSYTYYILEIIRVPTIFPFRAERECNCMSVAKRVLSIVYAPLFHRGCTFALKHMCTEFYDANHARHGTKSCSCCCCVRGGGRGLDE